jgi:hypothetical protein
MINAAANIKLTTLGEGEISDPAITMMREYATNYQSCKQENS